MNLAKLNTEEKFNSVFLTSQINEFRKAEGNRKILLHKSLLTKVEKEFSDEIAEQNILPTSYIDSSNRQSKCYELTFEESLQLLMSESKTVRKGVVSKLKELSSKTQLPQSFADALQLAADQARKIELQEAKLKEVEPKVDFYNTVTGAAETLLDMGEVAKVLKLGYGRNNLFSFLREKKVLQSNNQPYQRFIDAGLFRLIEGKHERTNGTTHVHIKTMVYQKGVEYIQKLLVEN